MTLSVSHNSASFPMLQSYSTSTREGKREREESSQNASTFFFFFLG